MLSTRRAPSSRSRRSARARIASALAALALVLLASGCGGGLSGSKRAFRAGRYADAQRGLARLEASAGSAADYALYRGLAEHAVGDRVAALRWLRAAREAERRAPGTLAEDDRIRLRLAFEALDPEIDPAN